MVGPLLFRKNSCGCHSFITSNMNHSSEIRSFRKKLEAANCTVISQINDSELELWMFRSGPNRLQLLQWCLCQLEPGLRDNFQNCNADRLEKGIIECVTSFGIERNPNVILGLVPRKDQHALWYNLTLLLETAVRLNSNFPPEIKPHHRPMTDIITTLMQNKDFKELLLTNVNLIPMDLYITPNGGSIKELEQDLEAAKTELDELQESVNNMSCNEIEETEKSVLSIEDYRRAFEDHYRKIQECYNHLARTVFPAVKLQPKCQEAEFLGEIVKRVAHKIIDLVQMLKDVEKIKEIADNLGTRSVPELGLLRPTELEGYISKSHSLITETISLMRLHDML